MKIIREFISGYDRYPFDFETCTTTKGFAQVDSRNDASYYGTWANPFKLVIIEYCEGDITIEQAENKAEFVHSLRDRFSSEYIDFIGIDPGFNEALQAKFVSLFLGDLLH